MSGTEGEPGSIAALHIKSGDGIRFIEMPISSFNIVTEGALVVDDEEGVTTITAGQSFLTPPNWSGVMRAEGQTTMLLLVV